MNENPNQDHKEKIMMEMPSTIELCDDSTKATELEMSDNDKSWSATSAVNNNLQKLEEGFQKNIVDAATDGSDVGGPTFVGHRLNRGGEQDDGPARLDHSEKGESNGNEGLRRQGMSISTTSLDNNDRQRSGSSILRFAKDVEFERHERPELENNQVNAISALSFVSDVENSNTSRSSQRSRPTLKRYETRRFRRFSSMESYHSDILSISKVRSTSSVVTALGPLVFILATLLIPMFCIPVITGGEVPGAQAFMPLLLGGITVLPATLFLSWCKQILSKSLDTKAFSSSDVDNEEEGHQPCQSFLQFLKSLLPCTEGLCFTLGIMFQQSRQMLSFYIEREEYVQLYTALLNYATTMVMYTGWIALLDNVHQMLFSYAEKVDAIAVRNKKSKKWKSIMKSFRNFNNLENDQAYAIPGGHRSPAQVLAEIVGIYANIGKVFGGIMVMLVFLGVDLYSGLVVLGLTVLLAGVQSALHINEAFRNVLALVYSNAIHVGEIISVGRVGFTPADNPETHVTGFVEGVTWTHVIIRDFKKKETFIRHEEFGALTMHNWSRRPAKSIYILIPIVPELSGAGDRVAKLAEFGAKWLKAHTSVDQESYQKSAIKITSAEGLCLEVIFFPVRGAKARQIRSEFIVMILDAAKRFKLCLMRAEVRSSSPWPGAQNDDEQEYEKLDLTDLLPSQKLTTRAGYKPKMS